jgi:FolB domain-containing protein
MMDKILIKDLLLRGIVGINDSERVKKQDILINLVIDHDLKQPGMSDSIEDTLNYKTITKKIIKLVETSEFYLVEKLAHEIGRIAVEHGANSLTVRVEKPMALRFADSVGVEIQRSRDDYV